MAVSIDPDSKILGVLDFLYNTLVKPQEYQTPIFDTGQTQQFADTHNAMLPERGSRQSMLLPFGYDAQGNIEPAIPSLARDVGLGAFGLLGEYEKALDGTGYGSLDDITPQEAANSMQGLLEVMTGGLLPNAPKGALRSGFARDGENIAGGKVTKGLLENTDVLEGLPQTRKVPNYGEISIKPNPKAEQAAIDHSIKSGVPYDPMTTYAPLDKEFAAQVAREYDLMPHDPNNKLVAESYGAMRDELYGQYEEMLRQGIKPEFNPNPYSQSPWEALADIQENNRLLVYPTNDGFGTMADFDPSTNPLLAKSPYKFGDQETLDNDIFRAVHDFQGHAKQGVGFRARGEENAFLSHAGTFSPLARKALASETRGQNSWLNYGKYGEHNRTAKIEDTIFADQKTGLLPNWVVEKNGISQQKRQKIWDGLVSAHRTGLEGAINPDGTITLMHRTPANIEGGRVDPSYYGRNLSGQTRAERARAQDPDFVPRTYWGVDSKVDPYKPEAGLGNNKYVAKINGADIYDAQKDSDGLWAKGKGNHTKSEKELWKEGYSGYIVNHPKLGRVVQLFDPVDATKKLTIAIPAGAAGVGLLSEKDDPQQGILN